MVARKKFSIKFGRPSGCLGIAWIFESKKAARDFLGDGADRLVEIELKDD